MRLLNCRQSWTRWLTVRFYSDRRKWTVGACGIGQNLAVLFGGAKLASRPLRRNNHVIQRCQLITDLTTNNGTLIDQFFIIGRWWSNHFFLFCFFLLLFWLFFFFFRFSLSDSLYSHYDDIIFTRKSIIWYLIFLLLLPEEIDMYTPIDSISVY